MAVKPGPVHRVSRSYTIGCSRWLAASQHEKSNLPIRSALIASYKKNTDGGFSRHNLMDWTAAQRERRDAFHDASWAEQFTQPRIPEGAVHLIIGDSLI